MVLRNGSAEYKAYLDLKHWSSMKKVLSASRLFDTQKESYPLFRYLYTKTKKLYKQIPLRKNGEESFIHPLNVVYALHEVGVRDVETLCAGLMHDYVEEMVDIYKKKQKIKEDEKGIKILDAYEEEVFNRLREDLRSFCQKQGCSLKMVSEIIAITQLLTRHKRDFYYRSISNIFTHPNQRIKQKALRVKLADRMHNILSIECFNEEERIYQCFKNLFILNNTKRYLLQKYGEGVFDLKKETVTHKLFKRSAKATYDAFHRIQDNCTEQGMNKEVKTMLQLAFKKFALEYEAVKRVTNLNENETHLLRLYQGVIRKYDHRLHHRWKEYEKMKSDEMTYSKKFFADFKFTKKEIKQLMEYKDAYSLKEVVTYLMYVPDYFIAGFEYSDMFCEHTPVA